MSAVINYLLEVSVCWGVFYLFYVAVLYDQPSYQYNRFYLLAASFLGVVLPLLEVPLWTAQSSSAGAGYILLDPFLTLDSASTNQSSFQWRWDYFFWIVYGSGAVVAAAYYFWQFLSVVRIIRHGQLQPAAQPHYQLLHTQGKFPTSSFFQFLLWDNTQTLSVSETQQMIAHEETHIQQKHSYDITYFALLKIIFWFHPLVYLLERVLVENHEFAADAGALQHPSADRRTYSRLLARQSMARLQWAVVNHFYKSKTLKRIKMMEIKSNVRWYRYGLVLPIVVSLFTVFSCQQDAAELESQSIQQSHLQAELEWEEIRKLQSDLVAKYFDEHLKEPGNDDLFYQEAKAFQEVATSEELARFNELREMEKVAWRRKASADADEVFMVVENQPTPEGGMRLFYDYIQSNLKYPAQARQMGIEGKVFVQFVVDTDGSLADVKAIKGIGAGCDKEAVRVVRESLPWNPGTQNGKLVKVRMVLPITFRLGEEPTSPHGNQSAAQLSEASNPFPDMVQVDLKKMIIEPVTVVGGLLKGKVMDGDGNPLPGTNILIRGTTTGTVTNMDGEFSISSAQAKEKGLVFAHAGYQTVLLDE